jgi:hypothetical protein
MNFGCRLNRVIANGEQPGMALERKLKGLLMAIDAGFAASLSHFPGLLSSKSTQFHFFRLCC